MTLLCNVILTVLKGAWATCVDTRSLKRLLLCGKISKCVTHSDESLTWRAWVRAQKLRAAILVLVFRFFKYVVFCLGLLLTRRWKLREVFMTVAMCRSQQRVRRAQKSDTSQSQEVRSWLLDPVHSFFLAWQENLMAFHSLSLFWTPRLA